MSVMCFEAAAVTKVVAAEAAVTAVTAVVSVPPQQYSYHSSSVSSALTVQQ